MNCPSLFSYVVRFPSGRSVEQAKKDARRLKQQSAVPISHSQALNQVCRDNGLDMDWASAMKHLAVEARWQKCVELAELIPLLGRDRPQRTCLFLSVSETDPGVRARFERVLVESGFSVDWKENGCEVGRRLFRD